MKRLLVALIAALAALPALAQTTQAGGRQSSGMPIRLDDQKWIKVVGDEAALLNSSGVVSLFRAGSIVISGLTSETIAVKGIIDPSGTPVEFDIQVQDLDGVISSGAALGNGTYYFDVLFEDLKLVKSSTSEEATVTLYFRT